MEEERPYVGRLAPSPTGLLHVGHARTFKVAQRRARERGGRLLLRIEDLDAPRCKPHYLPQMLEDLAWVGISWDNDALQPEYSQSTRKALYLSAWRRLYELGCVYPSPHSRKDVEKCLSAPHESDGGEPVFPTELRPAFAATKRLDYPPELQGLDAPTKGINWRLRVPDGRAVCFTDGHFGPQLFTAGQDFGDFVIWSGALDAPSYELAVVVDDLEMGVTEVVRGKDLLLSTARQALLVEALAPQFGRGGGGEGGSPMSYYHCPLVLDADGMRMAKRTAQTTLKGLREAGVTPQDAEAQALVDEG